jgi:hypothetical protein
MAFRRDLNMAFMCMRKAIAVRRMPAVPADTSIHSMQRMGALDSGPTTLGTFPQSSLTLRVV